MTPGEDLTCPVCHFRYPRPDWKEGERTLARCPNCRIWNIWFIGEISWTEDEILNDLEHDRLDGRNMKR